MTRAELAEKLAARANLTHRQAEDAVRILFDAMTVALVDGDNVEIRGFGSLRCKHYRAYEGRNPRTGKVISVPEKRLPAFRTGRELKGRLQRGGEQE
jgi:integration host factor subunit beta